MLNNFSNLITKKIKLTKEKILKSDVRNRRDYNQLIEYVFDFDLDVPRIKNSFIRKKTHPGEAENRKRARESAYKRLGDNYIDPIDVRYESYGLATTVFVDVRNNQHQHRRLLGIKNTYVCNPIETKSPSGSKNKWSNYEINNLAVLANHCSGMGGRDFKKYFSFLKLNTKSFHKLHDYVEDYVGKVLVSVTQQSMRNKLVEEIKKVRYFLTLLGMIRV